MRVEEVDKLTLQEAIEYSLGKLVEQGRRCVSPSARACMYQNDQGDHCAIGWLLDETNQELMDRMCSVGVLCAISDPDDIPKLIADNLAAFRSFQRMHDFTTLEGVARQMYELKKSHGIDISKPVFSQWATIIQKVEADNLAKRKKEEEAENGN